MIRLLFLLLIIAPPSADASELPEITDILVGDLPAGWNITVVGAQGSETKGELAFSINIADQPFSVLGFATWGDKVRLPKGVVLVDRGFDHSVYVLIEPTETSFFLTLQGPKFSVVIRLSESEPREAIRVVAALSRLEVN
ncbi:MAG: hypothetical protein AAF662_01345 [Pseudomonadota bacterium]